MEMTTEELDKGVTKIKLAGRLDVAAAGQIELRFNTIAGARRAVIVDLSKVTFLASMGMRMLLIAAKTIGEQGRQDGAARAGGRGRGGASYCWRRYRHSDLRRS